MKRKLLVAMTVLFLLPATLVFSAEFWASKKSNKYHYPSCSAAQRIKPSNLITFSSPEAAIKAGYQPCKICKPPVSTKTELKTDESIALACRLDPSEEKRGCCSHHGGVCGCQGGRALCCDGTLSPSCSCD